jgi:hypothetical protein
MEDAKKKYATLGDVQTLNNSLGVLEGAVKDENGSVLNVSDVKALAEAAASGVELQAARITALDGRFGTIRVEDLKGTTITGKTVQSADTDADGNIIEGSEGNA